MPRRIACWRSVCAHRPLTGGKTSPSNKRCASSGSDIAIASGSPDVDSAAMRSLKLALALKPRQVPPQRHRGDAAAALDKRLQRNHASLLQQRQNCCLAFLSDHF